MKLTPEETKQFDELFPKTDGLYNTESGWIVRADPKKIKDFINTLLAEREKGLVENKALFNRILSYLDISTTLVQGIYRSPADSMRRAADQLEQKERDIVKLKDIIKNQ